MMIQWSEEKRVVTYTKKGVSAEKKRIEFLASLFKILGIEENRE
jgi:hypothetical protein